MNLHVNENTPNGAGTFKEAIHFKVKNSGKWKQLVINIDDAKFARRCNGGDLRIAFVKPDTDPVVASVMVKKR